MTSYLHIEHHLEGGQGRKGLQQKRVANRCEKINRQKEEENAVLSFLLVFSLSKDHSLPDQLSDAKTQGKLAKSALQT